MFGSGLFRICFRLALNPAKSLPPKQHPVNTIHLPPVKAEILRDIFNNSFEVEVKKVYDELKEAGLDTKTISELISKRPKLFKREDGKLPIKQHLQDIEKKFGKIWLPCLAANPKLIEDQKTLKTAIYTLKKDMQMNDDQIARIVHFFPTAINRNTKFNFTQKKNVFQMYYSMTNSQIADLMSYVPFLANIHTKLVTESVGFLSKMGYTKEEFLSIVRRNPQVFGVTRDKLDKLYNRPMEWGVTPQTMKRVIYEHPDYLTVCPYDMLPHKIKLLKHFNVSQPLAKFMFEQYPRIFILSVSSLQVKLGFIRDRLKLPFEKSQLIPFILTLNYNSVLRPRAELILKNNLPLTKKQFEISNQAFLAQNNINIETWKNMLKKYPITDETDYRKKFFTPVVAQLKAAKAIQGVPKKEGEKSKAKS